MNEMRTACSGVILSTFFISMICSCKKEVSPLPVVTTRTEITQVSNTAATSGGEATERGESPILSKGVCWAANAEPTISDSKTTLSGGIGSFSSQMTELSPGTVYYVRAYATNSQGTAYGDQVSFTTTSSPPEASTEEAGDITATRAVLKGKITTFRSPANVTFEYGISTSYGSAVSPVIGELDGTDFIISASVTGLTPYTEYHFRIKAENSLGISYGDDKTFTTYELDGTLGSVTDADGNTYNTIVIGTQKWTVENLRTTRFNDGTSIPNITSNAEWLNLSSPAYCWYSNDETRYKEPHGALYNWFAVSTGKLCPSGWHAPTQIEWTTLINYLGGEGSAGGAMKETGLTHWYSPNTGATNLSGFTALASGARYGGGFSDFGDKGFWWTSSSSTSGEYGLYHFISNVSTVIDNSFNFLNLKVDGFSVRCIKDN